MLGQLPKRGAGWEEGPDPLRYHELYDDPDDQDEALEPSTLTSIAPPGSSSRTVSRTATAENLARLDRACSVWPSWRVEAPVEGTARRTLCR